MTITVVDKEQAVSDVDTNMMGIRSKKLYTLLKRVVELGEVNALDESKPDEVLGEIIERITINIPDDAFRIMGTADDLQRLKDRLMEIGDHLKTKFQAKGTYPFTILRICELCYDPLKYFRIYELEKFVDAIRSCCFVETCWRPFEEFSSQRNCRNHSALANEGGQEDVSLTKIAWISEEVEKELVPFIKEIDNVMSVNFGFEDDEDENADDSMGVELDKFGASSGDFVIEEYYEEDPGAGDDDDDDDDDYVEGAQSDEDDLEEEDSDDDKDDEYDDSKASESHDWDESTVQRKRKTMELDDYEYVEKSTRRNKLTTPKKIKPKSREGLIESPGGSGLSDDQDTPVSSQEEERPDGQSRVSSMDHDVSFLISPRKGNGTSFEESKIRGVTDTQYEKDIGSPLSNKAR